MNSDLRRMRTEAAVAYFKVLSSHTSRDSRKTTNNSVSITECPIGIRSTGVNHYIAKLDNACYLLTYLLYSMVQDIIWKADCHSACQKYPVFLWNPTVHYRVHTSAPLDPILSQLNPVRPINPCLPKVHLNVILPPTPMSSQWSLAFGPPNQDVTYYKSKYEPTVPQRFRLHSHPSNSFPVSTIFCSVLKSKFWDSVTVHSVKVG
jgi:hypothetical protein